MVAFLTLVVQLDRLRAINKIRGSSFDGHNLDRDGRHAGLLRQRLSVHPASIPDE